MRQRHSIKAAYSFDGESSTGMYKYGTNQIGFTAGGSLIAYIQSGATYGLVVQSKIAQQAATLITGIQPTGGAIIALLGMSQMPYRRMTT